MIDKIFLYFAITWCFIAAFGCAILGNLNDNIILLVIGTLNGILATYGSIKEMVKTIKEGIKEARNE